MQKPDEARSRGAYVNSGCTTHQCVHMYRTPLKPDEACSRGAYVNSGCTAHHCVHMCRTPLISAVLSNVANFTMDIIFIFVFGWGVAGAALATSASQYVGMAAMLYLLNKKRVLNFADLRHMPSVSEIAPLLRVRAKLPATPSAAPVKRSVDALAACVLQWRVQCSRLWCLLPENPLSHCQGVMCSNCSRCCMHTACQVT